MKKHLYLTIAILISLQLYSQQEISLEACRQMALSKNKGLEITKESLKAARQLKASAFTQFLPNFSANATYSWNEKNLSLLSEDAMLPVGSKMADGSFGFTPDQISNGWTLINGSPVPLDANKMPFNPKTNPEKIQWKGYALLPKEAMEFDIHNVFAGLVGFVQPVFMGGKIKELYKISKYGVNLAETQVENKSTELLIEVDEAYWRIISVQNKVKLAKDYIGLLKKLHSDIEIMIEEGVVTKADLLKVKVKLNEAEVSLSKAEDGLNLSRMVLNQLCGLDLEKEYQLSDADLSSEFLQTKLIPVKQAIENRPEVKAMTQFENIAKSNEKIVFSRFLPNIVLAGNYLISNPNSFDGFRNEFGGMFSVGVVANVPLFHFGDRIHTLNAAKSQRKIANLQLEEVKEKLELQIKQSTYKMSESLKKKTTAERNVEQADENLRYATEGFDAGVITSTELLGAQMAWLSAKSDYIDAEIDLRLCNLYLQKSQGTIEIPEMTNNKNLKLEKK